MMTVSVIDMMKSKTGKQKLEKKIASYSEALDKCNKILRGKVTTFYDHKIYKIVCFPLSEINNLPTAEEDSFKNYILGKACLVFVVFFCFS